MDWTTLCVAVALACHVRGRWQGHARPPGSHLGAGLVGRVRQAGPSRSRQWSYEVGGHGWGNRELQFYTEGRRENARVEDGTLIIEARREDWQGKQYTSARLNSRAGWTYGRIEVRAKLPRGRGTWPAIWMLPVRGEYAKGGWPDNGEIDIMEHVGFDPGVIHGTIHSRAYNHVDRTQRGATTTVADAQDAFHVYRRRLDAASRSRSSVDNLKYFSFDNERLCESPGGLAAVAVRQGLPDPPQSRRRR